jgi:hypothetical protein
MNQDSTLERDNDAVMEAFEESKGQPKADQGSKTMA